MNTRALLISGAIAGAVSALLSAIPIINFVNCLLCAWLWLGGIFAVWLYRKNAGGPTLVDTGRGAVIGLVAGLFGAVVASILTAIVGAGAPALPAETMAQLEDQLGEAAEVITNPGASLAVGILFNLILYPLFGAIGGLIGAAVFKNRAV
jgi:hypothetical protein